MINSAHEDHFDITYEDNLCFLYDKKQEIRIAIPSTNIPQMQVDKSTVLTNIEKARLAKAAKALE